MIQDGLTSLLLCPGAPLQDKEINKWTSSTKFELIDCGVWHIFSCESPNECGRQLDCPHALTAAQRLWDASRWNTLCSLHWWLAGDLSVREALAPGEASGLPAWTGTLPAPLTFSFSSFQQHTIISKHRVQPSQFQLCSFFPSNASESLILSSLSSHRLPVFFISILKHNYATMKKRQWDVWCCGSALRRPHLCIIRCHARLFESCAAQCLFVHHPACESQGGWHTKRRRLVQAGGEDLAVATAGGFRSLPHILWLADINLLPQLKRRQRFPWM